MILRRSTDREVAWLCRTYSTANTERAQEVIRQYIIRVRIWRVIGACIGIAVLVAFARPAGLTLFPALFIGWFLGGLLGEMGVRRAPKSERRTAALIERRVGSFLPPFAKWVLVASITTMAVTLAGAAMFWQVDAARRQRWPTPHPMRHLAITAGWSLVLGCVGWFGLHRLARKPFDVGEADMNSANYAIRSSSVVRVAAGWAALQFIIAVWMANFALGYTDHPFSWLLVTAEFGSAFGVLIAWIWVPARPQYPPAESRKPVPA